MDTALHTDSVTALGQHGKRNRDKLARIPVKIVPPEHARRVAEAGLAACTADDE